MVPTAPINELSMLLLNDTLKISRRSRGSLNFHKRQLASFNRSFIEMEYGESEREGAYNWREQ